MLKPACAIRNMFWCQYQQIWRLKGECGLNPKINTNLLTEKQRATHAGDTFFSLL